MALFEEPSRIKLENIDDYECVEPPLGKGSFGFVNKFRRKDGCSHADYPVFVAVKVVMQKKGNDQDKTDKYIRREKGVMEEVSLESHRNIVKYFGWMDIESDQHFITKFIMELCTFDLSCLIGRAMFPHEVGAIIWQVLEALVYLHGMDIIHRDIKPSNILVNVAQEDFDIATVSIRLLTIKLCDFGFAREIERTDRLQTMTTLGSPVYAPPELRYSLENKITSCVYDKSCDVFSVGVVAHELAVGARLHDVNDYTDFAELEESLINSRCGRYLLPFLQSMLHPDPKKRSTPGELLRHPYIQIGKEFYKTGAVNMTQLLRDAVNARLSLLSAIKYANIKTKKLRTMEKIVFYSGAPAGIIGFVLIVSGGIVMFAMPGGLVALPVAGFAILGLGGLAKLGGKAAVRAKISTPFKKLVKAIEEDVEANTAMKEELSVTELHGDESIKFGDTMMGHEEAVKRYLEEVGEVESENYDKFCDLVDDELPPMNNLMDVDHGVFVRKLERSVSKKRSMTSTNMTPPRSASTTATLRELLQKTSLSRTSSGASASTSSEQSSDLASDTASVASNSTEFTLLSADESIGADGAEETLPGSLSTGPEAFVAGFQVYEKVKRHRGEEGVGGRLVYAGWERGGDLVISWKGKSRYTM